MTRALLRLPRAVLADALVFLRASLAAVWDLRPSRPDPAWRAEAQRRGLWLEGCGVVEAPALRESDLVTEWADLHRQRDALIEAGADPADLVLPLHPDYPEEHL